MAKKYSLYIVNAFFCTIVCFSSPLFSAQLLLESDLNVETEYDDNAGLDESFKDELHGVNLKPLLRARYEGENWSTAADLELIFSEYNRTEYNSDDQNFQFSSNRRGEQYSAGVNVSILRSTNRNSELNDSGRLTNDRYELLTLSPYYFYTVNESNSLAINFSASERKYEAEKFVGSDTWSSTVRWTHNLNEKAQLFLVFNISNYESEDQTSSTGTYVFFELEPSLGLVSRQVEQSYVIATEGEGVQLGGSYQLSEQLSIEGLFGDVDYETDYDITDPENACNNPNYIASPALEISRGLCDLEGQASSTESISFDIRWEDERDTFNFAYSATAQPSSRGYLLDSRRYSLGWNTKASETSRFKVEAMYSENEALDRFTSDASQEVSNREFTQIKLEYNKDILEQWRLKIGYSHRVQKQRGKDASGNIVRFEITYKPRQRSWSF